MIVGKLPEVDVNSASTVVPRATSAYRIVIARNGTLRRLRAPRERDARVPDVSAPAWPACGRATTTCGLETSANFGL